MIYFQTSILKTKIAKILPIDKVSCNRKFLLNLNLLKIIIIIYIYKYKVQTLKARETIIIQKLQHLGLPLPNLKKDFQN